MRAFYIALMAAFAVAQQILPRDAPGTAVTSAAAPSDHLLACVSACIRPDSRLYQNGFISAYRQCILSECDKDDVDSAIQTLRALHVRRLCVVEPYLTLPSLIISRTLEYIVFKADISRASISLEKSQISTFLV